MHIESEAIPFSLRWLLVMLMVFALRIISIVYVTVYECGYFMVIWDGFCTCSFFLKKVRGGLSTGKLTNRDDDLIEI